ncbi:MAG: acyl carrier protein [Clostridiales bacterium]|nr:acyl carrier protein [Clostridiales bacterium]
MFGRLCKIIAEKFKVGITAESITRDFSIIEDSGADSIELVELIMSVEDEFGIEIPDSDLADFKTVGELSDYLVEHLAA